MKRKCFLWLFLFGASFLNGKIRIELLSQFYLEQKSEFIAHARDIAVDEKENIYVVDGDSSNIKIYNKDGKLLKTFGRKGGGPGEFMYPFRVDVNDKWICVQDVHALKYIIFDRTFKEIKRIFYLLSPNDTFIISKDRIIANGYFVEKNGKEFIGIIIDFSGKVIKALIPFQYPRDDMWNRVTDSLSFLDISNNEEIYFVKEREVKVFKFNKSGELVRKFGENPSYFYQCKKTKDFDLIYKGNSQSEMMEADERWRRSFSWVSGIFALKDLVGVIITNFNNKLNKWEYFLRCYDCDGNLLENGKKIEGIGKSSYQHFFMIDSNHEDKIYILETLDDEKEPKYRFSKYKVTKVLP